MLLLFIKEARKNWRNIIGSPDKLPLATRIYHTLCLLSVIAIVFLIPFKWYIGFHFTAILGGVFAFYLAGAYYVSKCIGKTRLSMITTCVILNILFAVTYFFNGGINGTETLLMAFLFVCVITVSAEKEYWLWTIINVIFLLIPLTIEYFYPATVVNNYQSREFQYLDIISTYVILILLVRMSIPYLIHNYNYSQYLVEEKAKAMLILNQEKSKLISIISHDIRAPLINIQSYMELLFENEINAEENESIKSNLMHSTRETLEMATNLLSWSKSQMDGKDIKLEKINVATLLSSAQQLYKNIADQKGISLQYHTDMHTEVLGNQDMLHLILRNLVNNAIKFTAPGGTIKVKAINNADHCVIEVQDSGVGKPINLNNDVFTFSAKTTYGTNNEKGVGLGLVLCREFAEAQGGKISFTCHPDTGTSFYVQIPKFSSN